jgi:hypothetical protein
MHRNVVASTSGIDTATTSPVRSPRLTSAQPQRLAPLPAHLLLRRIDVAALDTRDVAQPEHAIVRPDRDVANGIERVERAGRAQVDAVGGGFEHAGGGDRVLRGERLHDLPRLDAQQRQPVVRQLDEYLLVLLADEIDLRHARHAQELGADAVAELLQVAIAVAVPGDRVDIGIGIAELVVEERPLDTRGQRIAHVADFLAHLILEVRHGGGRQRILERYENERLAGFRVAPHPLERQLLQLALDPVGHLLLDVARRGSRPGRPHDHDLERERRILRLPEPAIGERAGQREHDDQIENERAMAKRPLGQVEARARRGAGQFCGRHRDSRAVNASPARPCVRPAAATDAPALRRAALPGLRRACWRRWRRPIHPVPVRTR